MVRLTRPTRADGDFSPLCWALWFAVLAGLGEAAVVALTRAISGRLILVTADVVWMASAINARVFTIVLLPLRDDRKH